MNCKNFQDSYLLFLYEEIDEKEAISYKNHLRDCEQCKNLFEEGLQVKNLYKEIALPGPPEYIINKIKDYASNQSSLKIRELNKKTLLENILNLFFIKEFKLALAGLAIITIILIPFLWQRKNEISLTSATPSNVERVIDEKEMDLSIKTIEYKTESLKNHGSYSGLKKDEDLWDMAYFNQKLSDIETEIDSLKKDFSEF